MLVSLCWHLSCFVRVSFIANSTYIWVCITIHVRNKRSVGVLILLASLSREPHASMVEAAAEVVCDSPERRCIDISLSMQRSIGC